MARRSLAAPLRPPQRGGRRSELLLAYGRPSADRAVYAPLAARACRAEQEARPSYVPLTERRATRCPEVFRQSNRQTLPLVVWMLTILVLASVAEPAEPTTLVRLPDGTPIIAEIAATPEQRSQGLSDREALPEGRGMLFVYDEERHRVFTMRRMRFDLDMLFLGPEGRINHVIRSAPHAPAASTPVPELEGMAQYVLEVPAGTIERHNLTVGDQLKLKAD